MPFIPYFLVNCFNYQNANRPEGHPAAVLEDPGGDEHRLRVDRALHGHRRGLALHAPHLHSTPAITRNSSAARASTSRSTPSPATPSSSPASRKRRPTTRSSSSSSSTAAASSTSPSPTSSARAPPRYSSSTSTNPSTTRTSRAPTYSPPHADQGRRRRLRLARELPDRRGDREVRGAERVRAGL